MIRLLLIASLAATLAGCPKKTKPAEDTLPDDLHPSNRSTEPEVSATELDRRRDAACGALGPRMTACAIDDARRTMTAGELAKLDVEHTAPIHTREFVKSCKTQRLSSRQVRVYEVCLREETECDPLIGCLENANPTAAAP